MSAMRAAAPSFRVFPDRAALVRAAAEAVVACAVADVAARGRFSMALSGGSTPGPLFDLLAGAAGAGMPWAATYVFWADERFVPVDHAESNYRMAYERLLRHVPIPPRHVFRYAVERPSPAAAARGYAAGLRGFFGPDAETTLDLALLGMGGDGHTASLFPEALADGTLTTAADGPWVEAVTAPPRHAVAQRLTLTLPMLNRARRVFFLVAGHDKAPALGRLRAHAAADLPAAHVQARTQTVWFVDTAASGTAHAEE